MKKLQISSEIKFNAQFKSKLAYSPRLTRREKDVARSLLNNFCVKKVSKALNISIKTVEYHCEILRLKMSTHQTYLAAKKALDLGFLD